jgi:hypothetical protein
MSKKAVDRSLLSWAQEYLADGLAALLARGDSADAVAGVLRENKCKGWQRSAKGCPSAMFLNRYVQRADTSFFVEVGLTSLTLYRKMPLEGEGCKVNVELACVRGDGFPQCVGQFEWAFDQGGYAEMVVPRK